MSFIVALMMFFGGVVLGAAVGFARKSFDISHLDRIKRGLKGQLGQVQAQNMRYLHEVRILNKKYRRAKLLSKKFQKERDVLKAHIGMDVAMPIIKGLYPEGNLNHLEGQVGDCSTNRVLGRVSNRVLGRVSNRVL